MKREELIALARLHGIDPEKVAAFAERDLRDEDLERVAAGKGGNGGNSITVVAGRRGRRR